MRRRKCAAPDATACMDGAGSVWELEAVPVGATPFEGRARRRKEAEDERRASSEA